MEWIKKTFGFVNNNVLSDLSSDEDTDEDYFIEREQYTGTSTSNTVMPYNIESQPASSMVDNANNKDPEDEPNIPGGAVETQTDAVLRDRHTSPNHVPVPAVNLTCVKQIEKQLDEYEIVSLVYLLYDNSHVALQELSLYLQKVKKDLIWSWARSEDSKGNQKWPITLVEALCIIQNYGVLKDFGYNKVNLTTQFLPRVPSTVINISMFKKAIYIICDNMNRQDTTAFLRHVENSFQRANLPFRQFQNEYLELYFLYWETMKFVSPKYVDNIKQICKVMEKESFCDMLSSIQPRQEMNKEDHSSEFFNEHTPVKTFSLPKERKLSTSRDTHFRNESPCTPGTSSSQENAFLPWFSVGRDNNAFHDDSADSSNSRYFIDPNNPGIVLIINQEEFYTDINPDNEHLLPPSNAEFKLDKRTGTSKDKERLHRLFTKFGFQVEVKRNLHHEDLVEAIKEVTASVTNETSLFVVILSHGDQVEEEDDEFGHEMTTDGPKGSKLSIPDSADTLTFWATVPGYAAIRNKNTGSWFIQAFCEKVEENCHRYHLLDICTRVTNQVTSRTWKEKNQVNAMTPLMNCTFRRDFYFPPINTDLDISEEFFLR